MSRTVKLLSVPIRAQRPGACGPYALEAVLRYYGQRVPIARLQLLAHTTRRRGTTPGNLARAARVLGLRVRTKVWADLRDLRAALKRRCPPIVLWFSEHEGHYSVVAGLDRRFIHLADPEFGRIRRLPADRFRRVWFDFSPSGPEKHSRLYARWMMVVEPRASMSA